MSGHRLRKFGRPTRRDAISGLVTGLFSVPEGMAYASIGGFNPLLGLYSGMLPTLFGALFARTVLMVTTLTSAIALTSQSVLQQAGLRPDAGNIATLTLLVGLVMLAFGLLRLGSVMDFVSNAVMTGFTTGIALQIVAGVIGDATGYETERDNTLAKLVDGVAHVGAWDGPTVMVASVTVAAWAVCQLVPAVRSLGTLLALVVGTTLVAAASIDVPLVGAIASIPNALPAPDAPDLAAVPDLAVGAFAVAIVALAQAAGIGAAVPNPDGSRTSASSDFLAQGAANLGGALTQALPTGGSLSRTGVAVSAGASTRWAGVFAGLSLALVVLLLGSLAEQIPMAVIGGLVIVIGLELITGRLPDARLVWRTSPLSAATMIVTFVATTELPLQTAIFLGAALSLLLYCVQAARASRLVALERADGGWRFADVPAELPSRSVTVLHHAGVGLFAEVPRLDESWPRLGPDTRRAVLVLSVRTLPDVPSSTAIKAYERIAQRLAEHDSRIILAGVDPPLERILERSGLADRLGRDNIVPARPTVFAALEEAVDRGQAWIDR